MGDGVTVALGQGGQGRTLGEVLSQEPVEVLVRPALPRVIRGREIERDAGGGLDRSVVVELGAVVRRDRLKLAGRPPDQPTARREEGEDRQYLTGRIQKLSATRRVLIREATWDTQRFLQLPGKGSRS